jgi:hypothetical protein
VEVLCGRPSPTLTPLGIESSSRGFFWQSSNEISSITPGSEIFLSIKIMDVRFPTLDEPPEKACSGVKRSTVQAYAEALPVGWQFSAGPSMPKWPQRSNDFISNSFGASISDSGFMGVSTRDFSDDALWNAGVWENWDLELAATTAPNSDFPASVSPGDDSPLPNHFPNPSPRIIGVARTMSLLQLNHLRNSISISTDPTLLLESSEPTSRLRAAGDHPADVLVCCCESLAQWRILHRGPSLWAACNKVRITR